MAQDGRKLSAAGRRMVAAALPENREARAERVSLESLMGSEDVEPGLERGDGFFMAHEVRATEPWHVSEVQLDERPRVASAKVRGKRWQRFHGKGTACHRARVAAQVAAHRAAQQ